MLKIKKPTITTYLLIVSLITLVCAFIFFLSTYEVFSYEINRWSVSCSILATWFLGFNIVNSLLCGEYPKWTKVIYAIVTFLLTYALFQFIKPCLSPIGIYFTVKNMGDTATNEIGVPRALITAGFYLVSIIFTIVASFLTSKEVKGGEHEHN